MSLVTSIKDYVDVARNSGVEQLDGYTLAYHTAVFLLTVVKETVLYCVTFHWVRDFSYFCLTPPLPISSFTNVIGNGIDTEAYSSDQPLSHLLAFSETNSSAGVGILFCGFLNGCFSCMHLSAAHLVTIRRMLVQGVPAGLCSALGTAVGQCGFLACVLFGFRGLLFPWLALEPLGYILGTVILLGVASAMAQDRRTPTLLWSAKSPLFIYVLTSAALAWCEQSAIFQWAGNFSLGAEPTFLETVPSNGNVGQLVQNSSYLVFFFLGSLIGGCLIGFILQRLLEFVLRRNGIAVYYGLIKQANLPLATLVFAFGFGSMPYYGFDYLVTKGLGFFPQEELFHQTLFSPINLVSKTSQAKDPYQGRLEDQLALLFTLEGEKNKSFTIDATPFDGGEYLKANQKRPQTFEDLNYRGEHLWTNRLARISNIKEQANQTQSSFLGPVFSWMRSFLWGDVPTASIAKDTNNEDVSYGDNNSTPGTSPEFSQFVSEGHSEGGERPSRVDELNRISNKVSRLPSADLTDTNNQFHGKNNLPIQGMQVDDFQGLVGANEVGKGIDREEIDHYLKEFDRQFDKGFSTFYDADPPSLIEVEDQWQEKKIKEKCYTNPIYKFLLNAEIDAFLGRQPTDHWLSPGEEALLLKRRQLLGKYYDTLALTNQVASSKTLEKLVPKSYGNSIYNHQFKGTLKIARRLFSVKGEEPSLQVDQVDERSSLAPPQPIERNKGAKNRVIKFDQPLFSQEKTNAKGIIFHEELIVDDMSNSTIGGEEPAAAKVFLSDGKSSLEPPASGQSYGRSPIPSTKPDELSGYLEPFAEHGVGDASHFLPNVNLYAIDKVDPSGYSKDKAAKSIGSSTYKDPNKGAVYVNEVNKDTNLKRKSNSSQLTSQTFSLEQAEPTPLYASWDSQLRKLIITNRFENRTLAGYTFSDELSGYPEGFAPKPIGLSNSTKDPKDKSTAFTAWPIPNPLGNSDSNKMADNAQKKVNTASASGDAGLKQNDFVEATYKEHNKKEETGLLPTSGRNRFLFQTEPVTTEMINALLQWQRVISNQESKQLTKENKEVAKEKLIYWPENVNRASWDSIIENEIADNDIEKKNDLEFQVGELPLKKRTFLWEFTPPDHGGFIWSGSNWKN